VATVDAVALAAGALTAAALAAGALTADALTADAPTADAPTADAGIPGAGTTGAGSAAGGGGPAGERGTTGAAGLAEKAAGISRRGGSDLGFSLSVKPGANKAASSSASFPPAAGGAFSAITCRPSPRTHAAPAGPPERDRFHCAM
jgi:hypothetical protein